MPDAEPPAGPETEEEFGLEALLASPAEEHGSDHSSAPEDEEAEGGPDAAGAAAARPVQPIDASCLREFDAFRRSGTRPLSRIRLIVIHSTEGHSARSSASWFANPESNGSAHLVVDDIECYRTLGNTVIPWGAPGANTNGFHVEHSGFAKWDRAKWMSHEQTLRRGAFKSALHAVKFGIPLTVLNANDLRHGRAGFVTHATVTEFHPSKGNHHDPGHGFPLDHFMALVRKFAEQIAV